MFVTFESNSYYPGAVSCLCEISQNNKKYSLTQLWEHVIYHYVACACLNPYKYIIPLSSSSPFLKKKDASNQNTARYAKRIWESEQKNPLLSVIKQHSKAFCSRQSINLIFPVLLRRGLRGQPLNTIKTIRCRSSTHQITPFIGINTSCLKLARILPSTRYFSIRNEEKRRSLKGKKYNERQKEDESHRRRDSKAAQKQRPKPNNIWCNMLITILKEDHSKSNRYI